MTPEEQELLYAEAEVFLSSIISLILILVGYGAFVLGFSMAVRSLLSLRRPWRRPHTILLVCSVTIFICFTWTTLTYGGLFSTYDRYGLQISEPGGIASQVDTATMKLIPWREMTDWPSSINILLSDGIVVWRAWCLFQQGKVRLILVMLMIANIGINVADSIGSEFKPSLFRTATLDWVSIGFSMMVNIVVVFLFALKAWLDTPITFRSNSLIVCRIHRQDIAELNAHMSGRGRWAKNILTLLIESGTILCSIQVIYFIVLVLDAYSIITSEWPVEVTSGLFAVASVSLPIPLLARALLDTAHRLILV
ncbi:hypothetical protein BDP27DRAFT_1426216 [Rhodocollybia butyracea]|uniref:Uncharacterized protein n=1 Tax=Rhodocollybia butyracea TaxID=206335 RepID=A0A9P5U307_9AGAR|nr:hypothetical protein BDP27DRAFT_1426216 [Rhodocollybia butyracea]